MKIIISKNEGIEFMKVFDSIKDGSINLSKSIDDSTDENSLKEELNNFVDDVIENLDIEYLDDDSCSISLDEEIIVDFLVKYNKLLVAIFPKVADIIKLYISIGQDFIDILS
ncbi:hypothetical protein U729_3247 (plasmid) [Clostridium baratii str. Sullivan]|uniref:Uncharacterized protein n=1 Tax=Clostridium baratii str. Sullivan TaxID=1415775 RepID=A0A0A7G309_9CLOT|nr:hypothetical protein [Clostridium baratii]AIY85366.1 hypothetical protein U729_3247 [Clostridium baratii str. Sullivan]